MIHPNAQLALNQMVMRAIRSSPLVSVNDAYALSSVTDLAQIAGTKAVALTVSSYAFRLTLLIYFSPDDKTKMHFSRRNHATACTMDEQTFLDAMCEGANMCCGNLNRDLVRVFTHVGMSTPNILDRQCAVHLGKLGDGYHQHFQLTHTLGLQFGVSLCFNEFEDLDFVGDFAEEEIGELEMF